MKIEDIETKVAEVLGQLSAEELEQKIAPVDCSKKPTHPDCQVVIRYGVPLYGIP